MANLTYATATISNGNTADATFVQGKFDDIKTYLENPGASAGIGTDNYHTNHADMCISFILRDALPIGSVRQYRTMLPAGISAGFAPTLLTFSQDNGMVVSSSNRLTITVEVKGGNFGSESSLVSASGLYSDVLGAGYVHSTTAFGSNIIASGKIILFEAQAVVTAGSITQGTDTMISLWGQALHRAKE